MLDKVLEDTECHPVLAASWCINAKYSLQSIHGFSLSASYWKKSKITINPKQKSASPYTPTCEQNRQQQNSKKIRHALTHNIRTSGYIKYITGDSIISAWTVENDMDQPKSLTKTANKCISKTEAPIFKYILAACNSLTKTAKTTKMH